MKFTIPRHFRQGLAVGATLTISVLTPAMAQTIGSLASAGTSQVSALGTFAKALFALIGFIIAGVSLFQWYSNSKRQQPVGAYILGVIIGSLMCSIATIMIVGSNSILNSTPTSLSSIGVN
ncbi:MAG: hypothetical protein HKL99_14155 [Burkholderiales bacterium]|nr:hypothetical protein [Burkholderiales bacterium]